MATPVSIAIRRTEALERAEAATKAIAEQTGAEIAPFPDPHKQEAMRPAIEAEWLADALEAIAQATDYQVVEGVEVESEGALAEINKLTYAAMDDTELCDILASRGYLQTIKDDKGNVSGVSWVGLGPDLTPDDEDEPVDLTTLSLADLKAKASELGIEDADKFRTKAAAIEAIEEALTAPDEDDVGDEDMTFTPSIGSVFIDLGIDEPVDIDDSEDGV